eukprot:CAMPEP_0116916906 /NCGR_PEP_ID=MMETSP0467-20121206/18816_1 /TAXON_ID=283647 /ORGANISM="Mesodinium pulex, Strain SPMC105" /LENGTH=333 /DNA_ID=CAMNT_0004593877 /DNA_START=30 /DNA_END=1031 /DNA_ORIENTATION=-
MLFKVLPFLAVSASSLKISEDVVPFKKLDTKAQHIVTKHRAEKAEKLSLPKSFSGKLAKFHGELSKDSSIPVESVQGDSQHLRALKMKDNFITYTRYSDSECTNPELTFGTLVNYCANEKNAETGAKRSTLLKIAKKEHTLVELEYEGHHCRGVPTKVSDIMMSFPEFNMGSDYGDCFFHDQSGGMDSGYYTLDYITTYPDRDAMAMIPNTLLSFTYPEDVCTDSNMNYFEFVQVPFPVEDLPPLDQCVSMGEYDLFYDSSTCESPPYNLMYAVYPPGSGCTGPMWDAGLLFDTCSKNEGDDDDDDDDYDDDGFQYVKVMESTYCTALNTDTD